MTLITKIRIEERPPFVPTGPAPLTREILSRLMLIVYDTAGIERLHKRDKKAFKGSKFCWQVPTKYCLHFHDEYDDDRIVASCVASIKKWRDKAVWFTHFSELHFALAEIKERYPDKPIPDQVSCVIDFPARDKERPRRTMGKV
jgi:hypothetical protein